MRSSDGTRGRGAAAITLAAGTFALLAGCSSAASNRSQTPSPIDCAKARDRAAGTDVAALLTAVENGPLYALLAGSSPAAVSCNATVDDGRIVLEFGFGPAGTLRMTADPRIEYTDQEARLAAPPTEDPVEILKRIERSAFPEGCGVDWTAPEAQTGRDAVIAHEEVFRGTTCNCQARVGETASGRVASLGFRSAC
jgi:hypothetical protein